MHVMGRTVGRLYMVVDPGDGETHPDEIVVVNFV